MSLQPLQPALLFSLFAISGFAGLIYESIWTHYLKLFLGHAAYAQALVLAIFMGGMALGAAVTARYSARIRRALLGYALVEGVIGLIAIGFHGVFDTVTLWAHGALLPLLGGPMQIELAKWFLGAALILPQSLLLGGTFPLMSLAVVRRCPSNPGYGLAMLYFTNSLGAALGVLVAGFGLIAWVGLPGTLLTAGLLNIGLALAVWLLTRLDENGAAPISSAATPDGMSVNLAAAPNLARYLLWATFLSSAASFFYEIGWIRMLSLVLGSATHSFELMLSAFILGLALGGWSIRRRIDRMRHPLLALAMIQLAMGALAAATVPLYEQTFRVMAWVLAALNPSEEGYALFTASKHGIAMLVMLPSTVLAGMTLPIITHLLLRAGHGERAIGKVYAINTFGAILGILLASLIVMPMLGVRALILLGALGDILVGVVLLARYQSQDSGRWNRWRKLSVALAAGVPIFLFAAYPLDPLLMTSGVYRYGQNGLDMAEHRRILGYHDGATATIAVYESNRAEQTRVIATNGKADASVAMRGRASSDEPTMVALGLLPMALHPKPKTVAVIGFGSGYTTHVLLADPDISRVDTIEIEPKMVLAARQGFHARLFRAFDDPRSHIHINDAKTYFSAQRARYDVIVAEPSNPWVSGVSSLFSREFYQKVGQHLNPGGIYVQWLQGYEIGLPLAATVFAAMLDKFEDIRVYAVGNRDFILVASPRGRLPDISPRAFALPALRPTLKHVGIDSVAALNARLIAGPATLRLLTRAARAVPNSDYFPVLDLGAERSRFMRQDISMLPRLGSHGYYLSEALDGLPPKQGWKVGDNDRTEYADTARKGLAYAASFRHWARLMGMDTSDTPSMSLTHGRDQRRLLELLEVRACPSGANVTWFGDLHDALRAALPYASADDLTPTLDKLRDHPCVNSGDVMQNEWLKHYAALATRDHARVLHSGNILLSNPVLRREDKRWLAYNTSVAGLVLSTPNAFGNWQRFERGHRDDEVEFWLLDHVMRAQRTQGSSYKPRHAPTPVSAQRRKLTRRRRKSSFESMPGNTTTLRRQAPSVACTLNTTIEGMTTGAEA